MALEPTAGVMVPVTDIVQQLAALYREYAAQHRADAAHPSETPTPLDPQTAAVDQLIRITWAARAFVEAWDAARVLGLATQTGASVPAVLAAIEAVRRALAGAK